MNTFASMVEYLKTRAGTTMSPRKVNGHVGSQHFPKKTETQVGDERILEQAEALRIYNEFG